MHVAQSLHFALHTLIIKFLFYLSDTVRVRDMHLLSCDNTYKII